MHETRKGEMSELRELPFGLYYGGVDTTPLFVMLAGAYARRTGDIAFVDSLWPAMVAAWATSIVGFVAVSWSKVQALQDFAVLGSLGLTGAFWQLG